MLAVRLPSRKVILFLTDGFPTFPAGQATVSDPGDLEAAVNAARVAQAAGIRISTYALGTQALTRPIAATEIARVTLGTFTPVVEPGAIVATLQAVSFANIEDVGILNLTTREHAPDVRLNPDGSFVAFSSSANNLVAGDRNNSYVVFGYSTRDVSPPVTVQSVEVKDASSQRSTVGTRSRMKRTNAS